MVYIGCFLERDPALKVGKGEEDRVKHRVSLRIYILYANPSANPSNFRRKCIEVCRNNVSMGIRTGRSVMTETWARTHFHVFLSRLDVSTVFGCRLSQEVVCGRFVRMSVCIGLPQVRRVWTVRVLVTVKPQMYREALALTLHQHRPDIEVMLSALIQ